MGNVSTTLYKRGFGFVSCPRFLSEGPSKLKKKHEYMTCTTHSMIPTAPELVFDSRSFVERFTRVFVSYKACKRYLMACVPNAIPGHLSWLLMVFEGLKSFSYSLRLMALKFCAKPRAFRFSNCFFPAARFKGSEVATSVPLMYKDYSFSSNLCCFCFYYCC